MLPKRTKQGKLTTFGQARPQGGNNDLGRAVSRRDSAFEPDLGARIAGVDLTDGVDDSLFRTIYAAFLDHQVLLFDAQDLPPGAQVAFARRFGEVQIHAMNQYHADGYPELYRLSNLDENGNPTGKHPDKGTLICIPTARGSAEPVKPRSSTAEIATSEREVKHTSATCTGAYQRLSAAWKARIAGLRAVHNLDFSRTRRHGEDPMTEAQRRERPPVDHPIVRTHPETARKCIFLGDHAEYILGMDYDEGRALIEELNALAVHSDLTYRHRWSPGQLILWDNRCVMHRATEYDPATQRRVIRRCTVVGEVPA